ncbi:MAG: DUF1292 domain-containing protein [Clostridia bacterium]|nr:DUF1292 domain-containing protein [Clostridia bacterium]
MEEKSLLDQLLDQDDSTNITIYDENNNGIEMEQVFVYPVFEGEEITSIYVILKPINFKELGMDEDEAIVFEYYETDEGEVLEVVEDEETATAVFEYYHKACDEN